MPTIQVIEHRGRPAALVVAGQAIIAEHLCGADRRTVQAKCAFALEIDAGDRPGPYEDAAAERFATARHRREHMGHQR